ncbi:Protein suppressor of hairy wing [Gryllus bimaculatus]|nr:Protein suppressor of hairy wing [Gryllus bimaculatus]
MSQALLAYTLPNGAQVLIPTLDAKGDPLFEANSAASIFLSGMQVESDDLDNVVDSACSSETNEIQDNLNTNSFGNSYPDKQDIFGGTVIVNSELSEFVEMHRSKNDMKDCDINIKNFSEERISKSDHICNVKNYDLVQSNCLGSSCDTIKVEEVVTLQEMLDTCETAGIVIKNTNGDSSQLGLDVNCDNGNCDSNIVKDNVSLKSGIKLAVEDVKNAINISDYMDIRDKNASEELVQLPDTVVQTADSVLKEVCDNVTQCLENESLKSREFTGHTNSMILDHLDEFAEMVTLFKCRLCKFAAGNKEELFKHLQTEHLEGPCDSDQCNLEDNVNSAPRNGDIVSEKLVFLCGQCSAGFNSINACKSHMMQVHELIVQESEEPGNSSHSENGDVGTSDIKDYIPVSSINAKDFCFNQKYPTIPTPYKCAVRGCQSKFSEEKDLQIHVGCHTDTENCRDFRCCECQAPFERWRSCAMHLWKVHNIDCGLLTCPICLKYKTATSVPLENHMRIHGEARSFTCPECGKGFKQAAQLHNHRVMHLDRKTSELPRWYASKQCNICFKNYANSKCLKKHIQAVHSKLRPYVCQVCGHASARKAMLQLHYRQHTGEKPHTCPLCDYRTGDHNSLRRHIMRHTGQRPYRCPHCPYSAIQSNSYKNHLRNKHPGQSGVFSCGQCSFKTVSHEGYLLHVADHKNGIINTCSDGGGSDVEVFPGNVAAAQLIYRCLNALSDGANVEANVTGSSTSADGTMQTITIQIPNQECNGENEDEVTRCFLEVQQQLEEENIDTSSIAVSGLSDHNGLSQIVT